MPSPLWRDRNFTLLWVGQALSDVGSGASSLAYPLLVLALTGSPLLAGVVGTVAAALGVVGRLPAGALVDRYDRRRLMVGCDSVRGVVMVAVTVAILTHHISWPVVLAVAAVDAVGDGLFEAAGFALLPMVVPDESLETAWAATQARGRAAGIAGPPLGGALFGAAQALPFLADAVSYVASVVTTAGVRGRTTPRPPTNAAPGRPGVAAGMRYVWRTPLLRAFVLQAPLINLAFGGAVFVVPVALRVHGVHAAVIGGVQAAVAVGALAGAVLSATIARALPLPLIVTGIAAVSTVLFALAAVVLPSPLVALPLLATGLLAPAANTALLSRMARIVPEHSMGRTVSIMQGAGQSLGIAAPVVAGALVAGTGPHVSLGVFAGVELVALVVAATNWSAWSDSVPTSETSTTA